VQDATPILDFGRDATVKRALAKERANARLYVILGFTATGVLVGVAISDGIQPFDLLYLVVSALGALFGISALASLVSFEETHPGLKVYASGLALPWRSRLAARKGEENFLPFDEIEEIRFHLRRNRPPRVIVVRRGRGTPKEFEIESKWIPDPSRFAESIRGKVAYREANDGN